MGTAPLPPNSGGFWRLRRCAACSFRHTGSLLADAQRGRYVGNGAEDTLDNLIKFVENFLIGEAQYAIAVLLEVFGARLILLTLLFVNQPLDFNDQFCNRTVEVEHEWADRVLATKPQAANTATAERGPQHTLRRS